MPYTAVRAVSSLPVAGAKMALSVHTWLTKHKEGPQITSFSRLFLSFFTVYTRKMGDTFTLEVPVVIQLTCDCAVADDAVMPIRTESSS